MLSQHIIEQKISFGNFEAELKKVEESVASFVQKKTRVQCLELAADMDSQDTSLNEYVVPEMER